MKGDSLPLLSVFLCKIKESRRRYRGGLLVMACGQRTDARAVMEG